MSRSMFDLNRDGKLDAFERAAEYAYMESFFHNEDASEDEDDFDELEADGLDFDELEFMDEDEKREALADAGW